MDPHTQMPQVFADPSDMASRDREVLNLAIRSLLLVHRAQNGAQSDHGAAPSGDGARHRLLNRQHNTN